MAPLDNPRAFPSLVCHAKPLAGDPPVQFREHPSQGVITANANPPL